MNYSFSAKIFWRFVLLYIVLYIYPYGFEYIYHLKTENISFWKQPTLWFGETFIGWKFNREQLLNGFDSEYDYSRFLLIAIISIILTTVWFCIDLKFKKVYTDKIKILVHTLLRYHVGFTLILYGLAKVLLLQFGTFNISNLETPIGELSGMRYLWNFMSYSKFYTIISGLIEVIGGGFLLFRKTSLLGAFILFVAMANVVLLDIGYDVRVKMFAIHLFLMTLLLMSDHLKGLIRFFITNKPTTPQKFLPFLVTSKSKKIGYAFKAILLTYFIVTTIGEYKMRLRMLDDSYPQLASMHTVDLFIKNGDTLHYCNQNSPERWKKMNLNGHWRNPETFSVTLENNQNLRFKFDADTLSKQLNLKDLGDSTGVKYTFYYQQLNEKQFKFDGIYKGDTLSIETQAKFLKDYKLTKYGIRWLTVFEEL